MDVVSTILLIIAVLVFLSNVIVEVLKKLLPDKVPSNLIAVVVSMALTLVAFFGCCSYYSVVIKWYYVIAAIVIGFMVSYAAMFGYDKLKQLIEQFISKRE